MALRYAELSLKSDSLLDELNTLLGQKSHRITGQHQWQKKKKKGQNGATWKLFLPCYGSSAAVFPIINTIAMIAER